MLSECIEELKIIDQLVDKGWKPCINHNGDNWHVGLRHIYCPKSVPIREKSENRVFITWEKQDLAIHAHNDNLRAALVDAINQCEVIMQKNSGVN